MKNKLARFVVLLSMFSLCACTNANSNNSNSEPMEEDKEYNVLFVGNSFTYFNSLDVLVKNIASNINIKMKTKRYAVGSHTLLEDADPNDSLGSQIQADLKNTQYTDVVLQDKSNYPYNHYKDFDSGVSSMVDIINKSQKNARISLYETWGYNSDNLTQPIPEIESTIRSNTKQVGRKYNLNVVYVGQAFTYIYENYPSVNLYSSDNKHPSYAGSFLAALVFVASLSGKHVSNVTYQGEEGQVNAEGHTTYINKSTLDILISTAENVVFPK